MLQDLALVVLNLGLGPRALRIALCDLRVVGWQDGAHGSHNRADALIELLVLRGVDGRLERRARQGARGGVDGGVRVLGEAGVMIGSGVGDGAGLASLVDVKLGVSGREDGVGCADDGADSGHDEKWFRVSLG